MNFLIMFHFNEGTFHLKTSYNKSIEALLNISQNTTAGVIKNTLRLKCHNSFSDLWFCSKFDNQAIFEKSHFNLTALRNLR